MKVLHVIPYLNPRFGGDVYVCTALSRSLRTLGNDVTIATTDYKFDEPFAAALEHQGVTVKKFPCTLNLSFFLYSPSMKAWFDAKMEDFDVVHLHDFRSYQNQIASRCARKFHVPYIVQAHGDIPYLQKRALKKAYDVIWGDRIIGHASNLFALTELEKKQYLSMGVNKQKISLVPNGIDFSHFKKLPEPGSFREKHGIPRNEKIVLYLGRLHKTKGVELLVSAYKKIHGQFPGSRLILIGPDDGIKSTLIKQIDSCGIRSSVMFLGFVTDEEKKMALVDADVFVTPSYSGYPITFLEACACGVPIVTTDSGDPIEWISHNYGYVTKYDEHDLSSAIAHALATNVKQKMTSCSKSFVYRNFDWGAIARKVNGIYGSILTRKTAGSGAI